MLLQINYFYLEVAKLGIINNKIAQSEIHETSFGLPFVLLIQVLESLMMKDHILLLKGLYLML